MRFFIDRCAGRRLAAWLRAQGHDVAEAQERGPDPGDRALLAMANAEGRLLVTMDKDFGQFVFVERAAHAGIIRLPDVPAARRIELMQSLLAGHSAEQLTGAVATVAADRVRISRPLT
jgi:predicted nuclease of predicted toxin-antitoxin system